MNFETVEKAAANYWLVRQELPDTLSETVVQEGFDLYDSILTYGRERHLAGMFPLCEEVLGDQWPQVALEFGRAHPSTHYSLREFGAALPQYFASQADLRLKYPFLSELAQFEKYKLQVLEAEIEDRSGFFAEWTGPDDLQRSRPVVNSTLQVCHFLYPVHKIVRDNADQICMSPEPCTLAIYRDPQTKSSLLASISEQTNQAIKLATESRSSYLDLMEQLAAPADAENAVESRVKLLDSFVVLQKLKIFVGSESLT